MRDVINLYNADPTAWDFDEDTAYYNRTANERERINFTKPKIIVKVGRSTSVTVSPVPNPKEYESFDWDHDLVLTDQEKELLRSHFVGLVLAARSEVDARRRREELAEKELKVDMDRQGRALISGLVAHG